MLFVYSDADDAILKKLFIHTNKLALWVEILGIGTFQPIQGGFFNYLSKSQLTNITHDPISYNQRGSFVYQPIIFFKYLNENRTCYTKL